MVTYSSYSTYQSAPSASQDPSSRSPPPSPFSFLSYSIRHIKKNKNQKDLNMEQTPNHEINPSRIQRKLQTYEMDLLVIIHEKSNYMRSIQSK